MPSKRIPLFCPESSGFKLSLLAVGHLFNDLFASFLPTFLPTIISRLGISLTQAGFFSTLLGFIHIIFQPLLGYLADRSSNPWLIILGPILTCLGATILPLAPSYGSALFFVGLWALGSAMFHPQGHGGVGHVVPRERLTVSLAVFAVAGTAGTTISPLLAVLLVNTVGYRWMPVVTVLPVLFLGWFIRCKMPSVSHESGDPVSSQQGLFTTLKSVFLVIYPVWVISSVRDGVSQGIRMFLPIRISAEGAGIGEVGMVLFFIMLGSTLLMLVIGKIADALGKSRILAVSIVLTSLFLFGGNITGGLTSVMFYVLGTSAINATMPITAAIAQELVPNSRGVASSIVMGLSWGVGNMLMAPFGKIGDLFGVQAVLLLVASMPLFALPVLMTGPFREVRK